MPWSLGSLFSRNVRCGKVNFRFKYFPEDSSALQAPLFIANLDRQTFLWSKCLQVSHAPCQKLSSVDCTQLFFFQRAMSHSVLTLGAHSLQIKIKLSNNFFTNSISSSSGPKFFKFIFCNGDTKEEIISNIDLPSELL